MFCKIDWSLYPDMYKTFNPGCIACTRWWSSGPFPSGMTTSVTTRRISPACCVKICAACSGLLAHNTVYPFASRMRWMSFLTPSSPNNQNGPKLYNSLLSLNDIVLFWRIHTR